MARTLLLGALAAAFMASAQAAPTAGDPGATLPLLQDQKTPPPVTKGDTQKGDAKKGGDSKKDEKKGESKKKEKKDEITVWILDASGKG